MAKSDYLIVGHGIAGALLGYFLEQEGARCLYLDEPQQKAATQVAAGIINPITGRRFVKSWRVDDLIPFAQATYRQLEQELNIHFYHERPLIRTLFNRGEENHWAARMLEDAYEAYYQHPPRLGAIPNITQEAFAYLEVTQTAQVSIGKLTAALQQQREQAGTFLAQQFQPDQLFVGKDHVEYGEHRAKTIIFCEGWRGRFNPWFNHLPFGGNKGEVLLVRLPEAKLEHMFKHRVFIVPFEDDLYWIGSTSDNKFTDEAPNPDNRRYLENRLREVLTTPFEIVDHRAAVRPTVKDRRPFLGHHPQYAPLAIFNGLGTKGASLAPFWARHLVEHLVQGKPLDPIVDIARFSN